MDGPVAGPHRSRLTQMRPDHVRGLADRIGARCAGALVQTLLLRPATPADVAPRGCIEVSRVAITGLRGEQYPSTVGDSSRYLYPV
jgi:hypothetical protein